MLPKRAAPLSSEIARASFHGAPVGGVGLSSRWDPWARDSQHRLGRRRANREVVADATVRWLHHMARVDRCRVDGWDPDGCGRAREDVARAFRSGETDRKDAQLLARVLLAGQLSPVRVPPAGLRRRVS